MKIFSYSGRGYLTLYKKKIKEWRKYIIGMSIHEQCYIVFVKMFHRQNVLLLVYLMHIGLSWSASYNAKHFVL